MMRKVSVREASWGPLAESSDHTVRIELISPGFQDTGSSVSSALVKGRMH